MQYYTIAYLHYNIELHYTKFHYKLLGAIHIHANKQYPSIKKYIRTAYLYNNIYNLSRLYVKDFLGGGLVFVKV